jgi:hypothetical protein
MDMSPSQMQPTFELITWWLAIKRRKGVLALLWKRRKQKAGIKYPTAGMSLVDMNAELARAFRQYRQAKKDAVPNREAMYSGLSTIHRKRILAREEQRRQGRISKLINGKLDIDQSQGVDAAGNRILDANGEPIVCETNRKC